jgi:hypothetical protein
MRIKARVQPLADSRRLGYSGEPFAALRRSLRLRTALNSRHVKYKKSAARHRNTAQMFANKCGLLDFMRSAPSQIMMIGNANAAAYCQNAYVAHAGRSPKYSCSQRPVSLLWNGISLCTLQSQRGGKPTAPPTATPHHGLISGTRAPATPIPSPAPH